MELQVLADFNNYSGWGLNAIRTVRALVDGGIKVKALPLSWNFCGADMRPSYSSPEEQFISSLVSFSYSSFLPSIVIASPFDGRLDKLSKNSILFTLYECTSLPSSVVHILNKFNEIIVASDWNILGFSGAGVSVPLYKVPLAVDTTKFVYAPPNEHGVFTFLAGGRKQGGGYRKNFNLSIEAFEEVHKELPNTRMVFKALPDEQFEYSSDGLFILNRLLSESDLVKVFQKCDCFVSSSSAEGWGWMPHEAMACGRPVIQCAFSSVREYFDSYVGYAVDYDLVATTGMYHNFSSHSQWGEPRKESLVEQMKEAATNRPLYLEKCKRSYERAIKFDEARFSSKLVSTVLDILK